MNRGLTVGQAKGLANEGCRLLEVIGLKRSERVSRQIVGGAQFAQASEVGPIAIEALSQINGYSLG